MASLKSTPVIPSARRYRLGFWGVALAFATVLGFTTVPTPLWSLFARRDGLSPLVITLIFASYAIGVAVSLFLVGHLSDRYGRRRLLVPALVLNVLAGLVFLLWPELTGLLLARALSGFGIGAINATATAWLLELHAGYSGDGDHRRAEVVAVAANLGGLGFGALISGVLAQWAPAPLTLPFAVFIGALLVALLIVVSAPETRRPTAPHPSYRPQHLSVPAASRARYLAAAAAAVITFAGFGLLTSLAPSFLSETLHDGSRALAGAVAFAVFASAALAQIVSGSRAPRQLLAGAIPAVLVGLGLLTLATWLPRPSLATFIAGVLVLGIGSGLMFKAAIATVSSLAAPEHRAGMLAGLFLAAYLGLAGPVIGLGVLTQFLTPQLSLLIFAALLATALLLTTPRLLGRESDRRSRRHLTPHYATSK